jgi:hypothetical protein
MTINPDPLQRPVVRQLGPRGIPLHLLPRPPLQNPDYAGGDASLTKAMWNGYNPIIPRIATRAGIDRPINLVPTMEREPESFPPNTPVWLNTNCPPWVCPPAWSVLWDSEFERCIPFYEQAQLLYYQGDPTHTTFDVPQDHVLVLRRLSYEALNAVQGDVFQFDFLVDGVTRFTVEDMVIDAAQPNPAHRYALAGHTRQIPIHLVVDRFHTLSVRAILRGPITLAGVSPYFPGQPIVSADCRMRVFPEGWLANLRDNLDGAPRPTDLGDAGDDILADVQTRGGYP